MPNEWEKNEKEQTKRLEQIIQKQADECSKGEKFHNYCPLGSNQEFVCKYKGPATHRSGEVKIYCVRIK